MSSSIVGRIDEMGNRIDDLEKSIADLMQQVTKTHYSLAMDLKLLFPYLNEGGNRYEGTIGR
ncbi:hypothetical protein EON65_02660 [archaeon]|nr:MAG: hypothetical protein EON65_02660 [archaeon]